MFPHPIVLHHGLFGYNSVGVGRFRWAYFQGVVKALARAGHPVLVTKVHPGLDVAGVRDLTTDACARFNEQIPDVPGVKYFSVSAAREWPRVAPFVLHSHKVISEVEGENDGLVSVRSATWGQHLCTWRADHF